MMKKRFIYCLIFILIVSISAFSLNSFAVDTTSVRGDINCDGVLDRKDCVLLLKYLNDKTSVEGETFDLSKCDYNKDGKVNMNDYLAMNGPASDLNGDKKLSSADFALLERYISKCDMSGLTFYAEKADYYCDGKIDLHDLKCIADDADDMGTYSPRV